MSNEKVARSVALEQAYVHDVYEQFSESARSRPWPRVEAFIGELEAGALVCDVGCGNGKYLTASAGIFTMGGEKCRRLCEVAREKDNEVLVLDNLALPLRDESMDAVLSIAVIHHFATTERRVGALRELARVLRIGGRLIISVWAMEQAHRKFESQDVLVPWHRPQAQQSAAPPPAAFELAAVALPNTSSEDDCPHYHACCGHSGGHTSDSDSSRSNRSRKRGKTRSRATRSMDTSKPPTATSPSSSSLSSPNETCYSFVRRAIQKLAGGRRGVHRPWFMESWAHNKEPPPKRYDPDGCECCAECDAQDLPIELRRVDDDQNDLTLPQRRQTFSAPQLSNDLSTTAMKSRSLTNMTAMENNNSIVRSNSSIATSNPEVNGTPPPEANHHNSTSCRKPKLVKQKQSICEEDDADEDLDKPTEIQQLLPDIRIENRTKYSKLRGSVQKQRSLNEELIMSTDRLQEKERLRKHIHKQASLNDDLIYHHRNSSTFEHFRDTYFYTSTAKRLQLIKNKIKSTHIERVVTGASLKNGFVRMFQQWKSAEMISPTIPEDDVATNTSSACVPPGGGGGGGGGCYNKAVVLEPGSSVTGSERRSSKEDGSDSSKDSSLQSDTSVDSEDSFASVIFVPKSNPMSPTLSPGPTSPRVNPSVPNSPRIKQSSCPTSPRIKQMPLSIYPLTKQLSSPKPSTGSILSPTDIKITTATAAASEQRRTSIPKAPVTTSPITTTTLAQKYAVAPIPKFKPNPIEVSNNPPSSTSTKKETDENLKKIKELLSAKPGFGMRTTSKHNYPIVRHSSVSNGKVESIAKPLPKLLSLELFNPETDDKDSDSSAVSSPDSVDSVISVETKTKFQFPEVRKQERSALLQAARDVAESLDNAVEKVIKSSTSKSPRAKRRASEEVQSVMQRKYDGATAGDRIPLLGDDDWNEECHKHLTDFADALSEKLLHEIDQYQEKLKSTEASATTTAGLEHIDDPYIHRLSEELQDLSKLSAEIQKQNEYLAKLSASDKQYHCPKCKKYDCKCSSTSSGGSNSKHTKRSLKVPAIDVKETTTTTTVGTTTTISSNMSKLSKNGTSIDSCDSERGSSPNSTGGIGLQLSRQSIESDVDTVSRYSGDGSGSTASLASCPEWKTIKGKLNAEAQQRASFDENKSKSSSSKEHSSNKSNLIPSLSDTSQESLPSDNIGGEITYHRYYHVFREGELDQLIEKYVENLHIISSYYDHASWCVVAEKVQVWTI